MVIGTRGNKGPRRVGDLWQQLDRQMTFLRRSCKIFDEGEYDEAIRIALTIRVLVHDTSQSASLLGLLGLKGTLSYVDTAVSRPLLDKAKQEWIDEKMPGQKLAGSSASEVGLIEIGDAGGGRVGWFAPLRTRRYVRGSPPDKATRQHSDFATWWHEPVVEARNGKSFSRSHLVLIMANQDGGGHSDAELDMDYQDLIEDPLISAEHGSSIEDKTLGGNVPDALHNVAFATVRQIVFELMLTIDRYFFLKETPGILALREPYAVLPMPVPPHATVNIPQPIITVAKGE